MSQSLDEYGRLYLPKDVRERFGETYRIVELPSHVALFPVDEDPREGARAAVSEAFEGDDIDELKECARASVAESVREDASRAADDDR
ncbi:MULTISPECIES: hypothetical protein [Halobacterium]|uniref:hypothetical protein n=1 Tax=Halobacterium TaxID=2239 RepID=UPI00073E2B38|nr:MULTISPECIES: hypothetical protein [Halobacterium]MCG1002010.1 AbrB/MazE/SpoVT family DNA-binding domain-containing protein [Halobacterium noricense]